MYIVNYINKKLNISSEGLNIDSDYKEKINELNTYDETVNPSLTGMPQLVFNNIAAYSVKITGLSSKTPIELSLLSLANQELNRKINEFFRPINKRMQALPLFSNDSSLAMIVKEKELEKRPKKLFLHLINYRDNKEGSLSTGLNIDNGYQEL